jgi:hypothetical protein
MAAARLAGEDFLVGLDRHRGDEAGRVLTPVPGLASTTAAGLARRFTKPRWAAVETGVARAWQRMLALLPAPRAAALTEGTVTIDIDGTDVDVCGRQNRGVAYNYQGQRCGRPQVAGWAEADTVLAAGLLSGHDDPRACVAALLRRALGCLPAAARAGRAGRVALRADAGYFAGERARVAHLAGIAFAIGATRIAPLWRLLGGVGEDDWTDAIDRDGAQVAVADYRPGWWPAATELLIRRVRPDPEPVSADPRSPRRRTPHPDHRALPLPELVKANEIDAHSFILTNLDVSTLDKAVAVGHRYRRRTEGESIFRDSKHGAALRHLPSGDPDVNTAWMWGALLAASIAGRPHQLTATTAGEDSIAGHGGRGGKAMSATLRHRLIRVPPGSSATPGHWRSGCHPATTSSPRSSPRSEPHQPCPDP